MLSFAEPAGSKVQTLRLSLIVIIVNRLKYGQWLAAFDSSVNMAADYTF